MARALPSCRDAFFFVSRSRCVLSIRPAQLLRERVVLRSTYVPYSCMARSSLVVPLLVASLTVLYFRVRLTCASTAGGGGGWRCWRWCSRRSRVEWRRQRRRRWRDAGGAALLEPHGLEKDLGGRLPLATAGVGRRRHESMLRREVLLCFFFLPFGRLLSCPRPPPPPPDPRW